jgi:E3 ubiquitin-protein ligase BRE1
LQSSAHRAHNQALQSQLTILSQSEDGLRKDLQRTQKAFDRQRMEHDKAEQEWEASKEGLQDAIHGFPKPPNGSGNATPNGVMREVCMKSVNKLMFVRTSNHSLRLDLLH